MTKEIIVSLLFMSLLGFVIYFLYRHKKDLLFRLALRYCQEAENYLGSHAGKEKMKYVAEKIRSVLPWWLDPLVTNEGLTKVINCVVDELQESFKSSTEKQIAAVNEMIKLTETSYDVNRSAKTVMQHINDKGFVEAYAQAKSDLHGNHNVEAGVRAGLKF